VIWARPAAGEPLCAITFRGSSYATACAGRYTELVDETEDPPYEERCKGCVLATCPIEAAKERCRVQFGAVYAEDVQRAKERAAVEMERFEATLPEEQG
jgi:hypothetical protein